MIKRLLSFMLSISMIVSMCAYAFASEDTIGSSDIEPQNTYIAEEDGVVYRIDSSDVDGGKIITITSSKDNDKRKIFIDSENNITITDYKYVEGDVNSESSYSITTNVITTEDNAPLSNSQINQPKRAVSYNSKVYEKLRNKYWYCYGNGVTKGVKDSRTFLKIGCKATYKIRTDNLSSAKVKKCDAYTSNIKKCNNHYNKAAVAFGGASFSGGTALSLGVSLIIANAACPPTVLCDILIAALSGAGAGAVTGCKQLVDAYTAYCNAKDLYTVIRTYGEKL